MRYILRRDTFLQKDKINEVFKNEVTWGGSLFGRLINSTLRKLKLQYDSMRMDGVLQEIENTIYEILRESMNKDLRVKLYRLRIKNHVAKIKDVCLTTDDALPDWKEDVDCDGTGTDDTKLKLLIGIDSSDAQFISNKDITDKWKDLPSGSLIGDLLLELETLEELKKLFKREELNDLRDIHSDFAIELRRFRWKKCNPTRDLGGDNARKQQWKERTVVSDSDEVLRKEISVKNESLNKGIFRKFSEFEEYRLLLEEIKTKSQIGIKNTDYGRGKIGFGSTSYSKKNTKTTPVVTQTNTSTPAVTQTNTSTPAVTQTNTSTVTQTNTSTVTQTNTSTTTQSITTSTTTTPVPTPAITTSTTTLKPETIADIWKSYFPKAGINENFHYEYSMVNEKNLTAFRLTRDDERELQDLENQLSSGTFTLNYEIASDAMVRLFNLLTVAYRLFATDYIPSGRPGGRVSMKTFQEYEKLGGGPSKGRDAGSTLKDAGGEAVIPDFGPWAKKIVYRKFQTFVNRLLQDQKLRKIFSNINFDYPGAEDKFNDSYKWKLLLENQDSSTPKIQGKGKMGPVLFNLLQDLATPSKCRGEDLIDEATRKYFGQEIQEKLPDLRYSADKSKNSDTNQNFLYWNRKPSLTTQRFFWCIPTTRDPISSQQESEIQNTSYGNILQNKSGSNVPIYVNFLDTSLVDKIETKSGGVSIKFYPPLSANKFYEDNRSNYTGYTDWSDITQLNPNIYYGYLYEKNRIIWIFYCSINESPFRSVHYQKVKINPQLYSGRKDPDGDGKEGEADIQLSALYDQNNKFLSAPNQRLSTTDLETYQNFYEREVESTGKSFKSFMLEITDDSNPSNTGRLHVIEI
jgi:hypothetical protein